MAAFRVPSKNRTVYFLFDADNHNIIQCDMRGKKVPGQKWEHITPQQFVKRHWKGPVSALAKIYVHGRSLSDFKREFPIVPFHGRASLCRQSHG